MNVLKPHLQTTIWTLRLAETKMPCFKRLGERVMARTFERQVVELHVRVALRFTQLGRPTTVSVETMA